MPGIIIMEHEKKLKKINFEKHINSLRKLLTNDEHKQFLITFKWPINQRYL